MARDLNLVDIYTANMDYWATERQMTTYFNNEFWDNVFEGHSIRTYGKRWVNEITHDLCWAISHKPSDGPRRVRNRYWDDYPP